MTTPRLRFAPSPTGSLHMGVARSALFNWLVARGSGGTMILRIEDTDTERNREEWVTGIEDGLRWLGLDWDEYYRQSDRFSLYTQAAERLFEKGRAYYCDCTPEALAERTRDNPKAGYDSYCADRELPPGPGRALRFRTPDEGATTVVDVIRGEPRFEHHTVEDFVLVRSNGGPMFLLANVVDDVDMRISHVVRGEEHLTNTAKYLLLWRALDGPAEPVFAHLPVIVNERRQKLSKRRPEDRALLEYYQADGYLPEALCNYLALLGWAPRGDSELLSVEELISQFRLEDVNDSPAFFDHTKLLHVNQQHIARLSGEEFLRRARPFLDSAGWPACDPDRFLAVAPVVQERVKVLSGTPALVGFLFVEDVEWDPAAWQKRMVDAPLAPEILDGARAAYESCDWTAEALKEATVAIGTEHGLGLTKTQFPIRVAIMGTDVGLPLFESMAALGRATVLARLRRARQRLS